MSPITSTLPPEHDPASEVVQAAEEEAATEATTTALCPICLDDLSKQPVYTLGCSHTFHCKCLLKYLAQCSVQQEHTYIADATYKLDPKCPCCKAPFSVKGVQRELRGIAFDRSAE